MTCKLEKEISIIIPARNEAGQIAGTIESVLKSVALLTGHANWVDIRLDRLPVELLVVDNLSTDETATIVSRYVRQGVRLISCCRLSAPAARNHGTANTAGRIVVFVDADTRVPASALGRICELVVSGGFGAGIFRLAGQEPSNSARCWWLFWNTVRLLPMARAKAMPAFMFCTREVFDTYGPFDEAVQIGEEWPILAGLYQDDPKRLVYDRSTTALTSSRRMEMQRFGYLRILLKYVWAILHVSGRIDYPDTFREPEAP